MDDPRLHFGLGKSPGTVRVEVRFQRGKTVTTEHVDTGRLIIVDETTGATTSAFIR